MGNQLKMNYLALSFTLVSSPTMTFFPGRALQK